MTEEKHLVAVNHTHPEFSNGTESKYLGIEGKGHQADYMQLAEKLPEDFDLAFTVSNHFETGGREFWEELKNEIERNGGEAYLDDLVFRGEYEDTRLWGLHSVEAAYEDELSHEYLIHGLELDDEQNHTYEDSHSLLEATEDAEMGTIPHPYFMDYDWGEEKRDELFDLASEYDADLSFEYSHGYGLVNRWANRGLNPMDDNLADLCDRHMVPAVPGSDWHSALPKTIALMDRSAIDSLEDDEFPTEEFRDMSIVKKPGKMPETWNMLRNTAGATANFADMIPFIGQFGPETEEEMQQLRDWSLKAYEDLDAETVSENKERLNGRNGILAQDF